MKDTEYKIIKNIFLTTFIIVIGIFFLHPKKTYATGYELQPWCSNTISEYNNPTGIVLTGSGGSPVIPSPAPVAAGFCPFPNWTTNQTLISNSGNISLNSSDFTLMENYIFSIYPKDASHLSQIISACRNTTTGNYNCDPRLLAAIWGRESSFGTNNSENFNCNPYSPNNPGALLPFSVGLNCSITSFLHYASSFQSEMNTYHYASTGYVVQSVNGAIYHPCKTTDEMTFFVLTYSPEDLSDSNLQIFLNKFGVLTYNL